LLVSNGSRNSRFRSPSTRRAASRSAAESDAAVETLRAADGLECQTVPEQQVMHGLQGVGADRPARRVLTVAIAEEC
jgi:hypothetical protein